MVRPSFSRRRNSGHVAQSPTRLELAISTRGAHSCVRSTPTGRPDCTSSVSSPPRVSSSRTIAWYDGQSRAARPRSEEHTSELQSRQYLVRRLLLVIKQLIRFASDIHPLSSRL